QAWENLLGTITRQLSQPFKLKQFLNATLAEIQVLAQVERVLVYQSKNQILCEAVTPGYPSLKELGLKDLQWEMLYPSEFQQGQVVVIDDLSQVELPASAIAQLTQLKTTAVLMAPLIIHEQVWGLLCVHQCQTPFPWEAWQVEQFSMLATLVAIAIYQFQLKEKLAHTVSH
ncbi:MAG: GAF domain-containing protein, partial [Microcystaceae cyanobacterium]